MKKRLCLLLLCACFVLGAFSSCSAKTEDGVPQGFLRAKSAELDLWLFYPETWSVLENDTVLKIVSYEENTLSNPDAFVYGQTENRSVSLANLVAVRLNTPEGCAGLDDYCENVYRACFTGEYVFDGEPEIPASGTTPRRIYTYHKLSGSGEVQYRFCQCLIENGAELYALTYTATDNLFEQFLSDAKQAMISVSFETIPEADNTPVANPVGEAGSDQSAVPEKEGYEVLTNDGVPYYLYYHKGEFTPVVDSGFIALEAEDHANVSVSTFDRGQSDFSTLGEYLDKRYFPEFDALYGAHVERSRRTEELEDRSLCEVEFQAMIGQENYRFRLTLLYHASILEGPINIVTGDLIYLVLYTARAGDYEAHLAEVDAIVRELSFK